MCYYDIVVGISQHLHNGCSEP